MDPGRMARIVRLEALADWHQQQARFRVVVTRDDSDAIAFHLAAQTDLHAATEELREAAA